MRSNGPAAPFVRVADGRGETLKLPSGRIYPPGGRIEIETDQYRAAVATQRPSAANGGGNETAATHGPIYYGALAPAYLTAALFAFLASMDNYPVSIFLTDTRAKTLPVKMLQYIEESPDPSIAALSTLILVTTLMLLFVADRAIGLHRLAGLEA